MPFMTCETSSILAFREACRGSVVADTRTVEQVRADIERANMKAYRETTNFISGSVNFVIRRLRKKEPVGRRTH